MKEMYQNGSEYFLLFAAFYIGFLTGIAFISFWLGRMK